ncbi:hypothetical protein VTH8203_00859 [Vibrio thalassae]|uniref:Uncharacterized protein n=1 Tax=Vibrio thalassae TaxID=1243014 RepID=A0A240EEY9_9VIBR|nr:hypothetical protein [Vibrio thalassae]SNX47258.1 hypothetical protein VTH8203_00859 [Vibrio thalassae]
MEMLLTLWKQMNIDHGLVDTLLISAIGLVFWKVVLDHLFSHQWSWWRMFVFLVHRLWKVFYLNCTDNKGSN